MSETHSAPTVLNSPFCAHIRSKRYYFLDTVPTEASQLLDNSNNCWCGRTMQAFGPDGEFTDPTECGPERGCYRSVFATDTTE